MPCFFRRNMATPCSRHAGTRLLQRHDGPHFSLRHPQFYGSIGQESGVATAQCEFCLRRYLKAAMPTHLQVKKLVYCCYGLSVGTPTYPWRQNMAAQVLLRRQVQQSAQNETAHIDTSATLEGAFYKQSAPSSYISDNRSAKRRDPPLIPPAAF